MKQTRPITRISRSAMVVAILIGSAILVVAVRAYNGRSRDVAVTKPPAIPLAQGSPTQRAGSKVRLSFQPEADRFRRKLGKRFTETGLERATIEGTLSVGGKASQARMIRTQEDDGEQVEIALGGGGSFTWSATDGARSTGASASGADRTLIERIALDSPDQFILAQLRGANYFVVARMVAPKGADEDYTGPIWNLIRIVEPQQGDWNKPQNEWRIYHINIATGLIDRITYQDQGQNITVDFSGWTNHQGELEPSLIRWSREGNSEMELSLNKAGYGSR